MELIILEYHGNEELVEDFKEVYSYEIKLNIGNFRILRTEYFDEDGDGKGENLEIFELNSKGKINDSVYSDKSIEDIFGELNLKVEEDCEISLWKHEYIDVDNILNKKYNV
tara:strand:+ start:444 stop:776 length:333 start_codon:yes stop_codon:yes gene_type:complete